MNIIFKIFTLLCLATVSTAYVVNRNYQPCDNFYEYVCTERPETNYFDQIHRENMLTVINALKKEQVTI